MALSVRLSVRPSRLRSLFRTEAGIETANSELQISRVTVTPIPSNDHGHMGPVDSVIATHHY